MDSAKHTSPHSKTTTPPEKLLGALHLTDLYRKDTFSPHLLLKYRSKEFLVQT